MRNFIYNKSDLMVALGIILVATILILTRVHSIMNYQAPVPPSTPKSGTEESVDPATTETPSESTGSGSSSSTSGKTIELTILSGESAYSIAESLVEAKLIKDTTVFLESVQAMGFDTSLKPGTFEIPSDATVEEIIVILTS
ncbi:MAG: hypothetical protein LBU41_03200 [Clostridiales Family XIII bacterium]|jgi:hypothetical protein|nr:hypothetical protein [Clostridiales Family XIII bacterium]